MHKTKLMLLRAVALAVFVIGIISPFVVAPTGLQFCDEPYQILVAQNYLEAPMSFFSGFLSSIWGNAFGFDILTMRYYAVTCQLLALLACCAYMYSKIRKPWLCLFITGICSFLTNSSYLCLVFGWDATSTLFIVLTAVVLFLYIDNPLKITWLVLAGLLTTCAAFSRIPNVVIAPIVVAIILAYQPNGLTLKQRIINAAIYVLTVAILSAILICSAYGSFTAYFQKIAEGAVSNHSLRYIIFELLNDYFRLVINIAVMYLLYVGIRSIYKSHCRKTAIAILILLGYPFLSVFINSGNLHLFIWNTAALTTLLALFALQTIHLSPSKSISHLIGNSDLVKLCIVGVFIFMPVIGSNTGLLKAIPVIVFPLFLSTSYKQFNKPVIIFTVVITTIAGFTMVTSLSKRSFWDVGYRDATSIIQNVPKLKGIRTNPEHARDIALLDSIIDTNQNANIIFVSKNAQRFIGYYLKGQKPNHGFHDWNTDLWNNPHFVDATIISLKNSKHPHSIVVVVEYLPEEEQSLMANKLNQLRPSQIEIIPSQNALKLYHFHN